MVHVLIVYPGRSFHDSRSSNPSKEEDHIKHRSKSQEFSSIHLKSIFKVELSTVGFINLETLVRPYKSGQCNEYIRDKLCTCNYSKHQSKLHIQCCPRHQLRGVVEINCGAAHLNEDETYEFVTFEHIELTVVPRVALCRLQVLKGAYPWHGKNLVLCRIRLSVVVVQPFTPWGTHINLTTISPSLYHWIFSQISWLI